MEKMSLCIIDDYLLNRIYYKKIVENNRNYFVKGHFSSIKEFIINALKNHPDFIFIDLKLINFKNLYALKILKLCFKKSKIIALVSKNDGGIILNSLQYGINSYVLKEKYDILKILETANQNEFLINFQLLDKILPNKINFAQKSNNLRLTNREVEVLKLVAQGKTNSQIADKIVVSINTAKAHVASIFEKLSVKDRVQATVKAIELSIL